MAYYIERRRLVEILRVPFIKPVIVPMTQSEIEELKNDKSVIQYKVLEDY